MRQRSGGLVILVVSIIAGLAAALLSISFLRSATHTTTVLAAKSEIQPFTQLTPDLFVTKQVPISAVPADAVTSPSAFQGKYSRTLILPDTILRKGHLSGASGSNSSVAVGVTETGKPGTVALAIPVDNTTAVGGTIQPGDRVEVIAAVRIERQNGPATMYAKAIAHTIPVISITQPEGTATKGTIVVQVTPQQAEDIAFAQLAGTIYLATDPYESQGSITTLGVTPDSFIQRYGGR